MIPIPSGNTRELTAFALELIEQCRVSVGVRASFYRTLNTICETGRPDGTKSLINLMHAHLQRVAANLFSPVELKFSLDFDNAYPATQIERATVVAKQITRAWERQNIDFTFARGVFESLKYGAAILKQWPEQAKGERNNYNSKLVLPWQFGVYREDETSLDKQEALCETSTLTMPEVWRRIWHLPGAEKLFGKIKQNSHSGSTDQDPSSFFHQVLSSSQLNTSGIDSAARPLPGGIVQIGNEPSFPTMGPVIAPEAVQMHELWVKGEEDYVTIQVIEPDILIAPLYKKANLLGVSGLQPYSLIQPNEVTNWIWGRPELVDQIEPQTLLSVWMDDLRRLFGLQIDKILAFAGDNGITDENYGQFRSAGFFNLGPGGSVNDLTPKIPPETLPMLQFLIQIINMIGSFPEIMQGKGEAGVRAGVHAATLLKTASPTLRDRALLVERQCAAAADATLQIKEAKDSNNYWVDPDNIDETSFLLADLPDDWRVTVDSHSSSPIFADENQQLILGGLKMGYIDGEYAIDNLPYPNKEQAKARLKRREKAKAQEMAAVKQQNPELAAKVAEKTALKSLTGAKR